MPSQTVPLVSIILDLPVLPALREIIAQIMTRCINVRDELIRLLLGQVPVYLAVLVATPQRAPLVVPTVVVVHMKLPDELRVVCRV
ncbi:MAG: hypothetical protein WC004_03230 [Candidatus Absconditabacterales bacterium]